MTLEDLRYKKEKWTKELLNLNANLNTYCKKVKIVLLKCKDINSV